MSSSPTPAPCCGDVVEAGDALDRGECPACGTDLQEMFRLARRRDDGVEPRGGES